jgi:1-acyl-sn-glycerol-3-phosphate acyltransferase
VLAIVRFLTLLIYFILMNSVLLLIFISRPFHRSSVALGGQWYGSMAKIMGLKVIVQGRHHVDPKQTYVCIANHQNSFDLITICKAAFNGVVTVGKKSLIWIPFFGLIYYFSGNIMIDRKNSGKARDTLKFTAKKILDGNFSVWFFPEGTRSYGKGLLPFKTGAFRIAEQTGKSLLMICASDTHHQIKWNRWNNGTVLVKFYEPEPLNLSMDIKGNTEHFHHKMETRLAKLTDEAKQLNRHIQA